MRRLLLLALVVVIWLSPAIGADLQRPTILVYSADMPGFASRIANALQEHFGSGYNFTVVSDPSLLSALLPMPDTACVILAVMGGREVRDLVDPLVAYFENGGAAIGFQGCCSQAQADGLARSVFPIFGNSTGAGVVKDGRPVNEYVREQTLPDFSDLPDHFDLIGQFFTFSADLSRRPVSPKPQRGHVYTLFKDSKSGAPLVVAYENEEGSRSVSLTGCFVRPMQGARNYYGKLVDDPLFVSLLEDSLNWTLKGKTRYSSFRERWPGLIQSEKDRIAQVRKSAEEREMQLRRSKMLALSLSWVGGLAACLLILRWGFRPTRKG